MEIFPYPIIKTKNLILRKLEIEDASDLYFAAKNPDVSKYLIWNAHKNIEESKQLIQQFPESYDKTKTNTWGIALKSDNRIIGMFTSRPYNKAPRTEIGYWISKNYWGKGYMTEVVKAFINYCFDELKLIRVQAVHSVINPASGKVMKKAGMIEEGYFRKYSILEGRKPLDCKLYAIVDENEKN